MLLKVRPLSYFALSQKALERSSIDPVRISIKSKNILNVPVHFSLVLGDLIANRNIEYGSVDDSSIPPLTSNTLIFLSFLFARNPNKGVISLRVRCNALQI